MVLGYAKPLGIFVFLVQFLDLLGIPRWMQNAFQPSNNLWTRLLVGNAITAFFLGLVRSLSTPAVAGAVSMSHFWSRQEINSGLEYSLAIGAVAVYAMPDGQFGATTAIIFAFLRRIVLTGRA